MPHTQWSVLPEGSGVMGALRGGRGDKAEAGLGGLGGSSFLG